jgi:hypothetical protein
MTSTALDQYHELLPKFGPFPTLWRVSDFLGEHVLKTWRGVELGELKTVNGTRVVRIKLESVAELLNRQSNHSEGAVKSKKTPMDDFETGPNVARILDVDAATVRRYAREGMPHHVLGEGYVRFKLEEVLAWLAQRERKTKKEAAN